MTIVILLKIKIGIEKTYIKTTLISYQQFLKWFRKIIILKILQYA